MKTKSASSSSSPSPSPSTSTSSSLNNKNMQQKRGDVGQKTKRPPRGNEQHPHPPPPPHHTQHQKQVGEGKAEQLSTRICIKNLPPLCNKKKQTNSKNNASDSHNHPSAPDELAAQAELRRHLQHLFSTMSQFRDVDNMKMTDVKLLAKRRMAFVGFATALAATKSVEYLHQSYYKTSRLVVEFATSTNTTKSTSKQHQDEQDAKAKTHGDKSKSMAVVDRKKQEFLAVMGFSQKASSSSSSTTTTTADPLSKKEEMKKSSTKTTPTRPFWANDDIMSADAAALHASAEEDVNNDDDDDDVNDPADDDENHKETTVNNGTTTAEKKDSLHENDDDSCTSSSSSSSDDEDEDNADPSKRTMAPTATSNKTAQSDWDFLKSKTVNVQDLAQTTTTAATSTTRDDQDSSSDTTTKEEKEEDEAVPLAAPAEHETQMSIRNDQQGSLMDTSSRNRSSSSIEQDNILDNADDENDINNSDGHENKTDAAANDDDDENDNNEDPCRLFVRNLPFSTTRDELMKHFAGSNNNDSNDAGIIECHVPTLEHDHHDNNHGSDDAHFYKCKGFAFVTFSNAHDAMQARNRLDGRDFQGRLLHILPARKAPAPKDSDTQQGNSSVDLDKVSYKQRQDYLRRQQENVQGGGTGWSASFVRGDAVVDTLASRLGLRKGDVLNVKDASSSSGRGLSAGDAAVRLALGETAVIEENRLYFSRHGIDMEALVSLKTNSSNSGASKSAAAGSRGKEGKDDGIIERSKTSILVKNLPHDTTQEDLLKLFGSATTAGSGAADTQLSRILLPPSRTVAVVEYRSAKDAKSAFRRLAYRRFKNVPIYLEWAPLAAATEPTTAQTTTDDASAPSQVEGNDASVSANNDNVDDDEVMDETGPTPTIYVKNLSFHTSEEDLLAVFAKQAKDVRAVRIPKKVAPMKRGGTTAASSAEQVRFLSMGYGFVEFGSRESVQTVMKTLQGTVVAGHALQLSVSTGATSNATQTAITSNKRNLSKLVVRNVPFQASRKELLQLFGSFGQLKKVRLPKKFDGNHRGFCFIEFVTRQDAITAVKALSRTHLYGRRLVIEWADQADEDESELEGLRERAKRDMDHHHHNDSKRNKKIRFDEE